MTSRIAWLSGAFGGAALLALLGPACGASTTTVPPDETPDGGGGGDATSQDDGGGTTLDGGDAGSAIDATPDTNTCVGLQCYQTNCDGGDTTLSGVVYAPNGTLPLYNAIVYVPNAPLDPIPAGVTCDRCGAAPSGKPLNVALSDATGHFSLKNMPSGNHIPLVVQLGKWRRATTIPQVTACTETKLTDPNLTRLPRNQKEGHMPRIALVTGGCDAIGCMLPKLGIDPIEFGYEADGDTKAINSYNGSTTVGAGLPSATPAANLWGDINKLKKYDLAIFSCECSEAPDSKGTLGAPAFQVVTDYLSQGGRIFTSDFQYTWYKFSPDPNMGLPPDAGATASNAGIGQIVGGAPTGNNPLALDSTFPKGKALADWLQAAFPTSTYASVQTDFVFANIQSLVASKSQTWASSGGPTGPRVFTANTPVGQPLAMQCGKGIHVDAHSIQPGTTGDSVTCGSPTACFPATCPDPLKEGVAMTTFLFFDLASCIQDESMAPQPPPLN